MEENLIKVYVKVDTNNVIININSDIFIKDTENWIQIDEGRGDSYAHAQNSYLDKGLMDDSGNYNYKLVNGEIILRTDIEKIDLDKLKQAKLENISLACRNAIYGGFTSTAYQGIEKTYSTSLEDQSNITGNSQGAISKVAGVAGCQTDKFYYHAAGEDFVEWTAEECLQLARDFKIFKETQLVKSKMLQSYVNTLTTVDKINAVTWDTVIPSITT